MNCFYHAGVTAVGICKSCGRGICTECAIDIGNGLACKSRCEERARTINQMIDANTKVLTTANTQLRRNMLFTLVASVLFVLLGLSFGYQSPPGIIFVALGVAFFFRGVFSYTRAARYPTPDTPA
jgi:hypothetical protein